MEGNAIKRVSGVSGPEGLTLTPKSLPPRNTRWFARRKAEVIVAVRGGMLAMVDTIERYTLSVEEFTEWEHAYERGGLLALCHCENHRLKDGASLWLANAVGRAQTEAP